MDPIIVATNIARSRHDSAVMPSGAGMSKMVTAEPMTTIHLTNCNLSCLELLSIALWPSGVFRGGEDELNFPFSVGQRK
jgi:hypothetical protein